ncbi:MAG TPA: type II toxin-antitoxin system VapC family toxin [Solirubrobacteraceae bacterium]|nr:type II toxin-antitoxin system VapC family toxin [Solirubrobacteraceae bacterium]
MVQAAEALVVDASVAAKWPLIDEPDADQAARLLLAFTENRVALLAPRQIRHEVPSSITVATLGAQPRLSVADGEAAIQEFLGLDLLLTDDAYLAVSAYYLVHQLRIAYYDALYVALSQRHTIPFVTADNKLYTRVRHLPAMLWLGNWRLAGG